MSKNIYKEYANKYFLKGINVIPDGYASKRPPRGFMNWSKYCDTEVTKDLQNEWFDTYTETNIAVPLGSFNNLCVIDVDTDDEKFIKFLEKNLPPSPVERVGSKGFVRFYRGYPGISNYMVKDNCLNVIFEVLAANKKVTIAPSIHPAGMKYKWNPVRVSETKVVEGLLDLDSLEDLPILPPALVSNLQIMMQAEFPDRFGMPRIVNAQGSTMRVVNGRTDSLRKQCCILLDKMDKGEPYSLIRISEELVQFDIENHEAPLFDDLFEQSQRHSHALTNALKFAVSILDSIQAKRFKNNQMYSTINGGGYTTDEEISIYELGLQYKQIKSGALKKIKKTRVEYDFE